MYRSLVFWQGKDMGAAKLARIKKRHFYNALQETLLEPLIWPCHFVLLVINYFVMRSLVDIVGVC